MPNTIETTINKSPKFLLAPGHRACAGCGQLIAARAVAEALGPNTIIANATGCLEVVTTPYPESSWGVPWVHSLFENAPAIASGISAALSYKSKIENHQSKIQVVAQGGDGSTFDIGFGLLSGMWERGENILYICYDNEGYMNTGAQASGATPWAADTTTTPGGSSFVKKDLIAIALAHGLKYVAQATVGFPLDIAGKVKKALAAGGPSYIQILVPCVPGWKIESSLTIKLAKMAALNGLYPVMEYENGKLGKVIKTVKPLPPVEDYLKAQGRYKHLFRDQAGKERIEQIRQLAMENIKKYNLDD